jgi:hypothetical protein
VYIIHISSISSIGSIAPIQPIEPVPAVGRFVNPFHKIHKISGTIKDERIGNKIDITLGGPLTAPNCRDCLSYQLTWNPEFPHGCKKFNFMCGGNLPWWYVYKDTGNHCPAFEKN